MAAATQDLSIPQRSTSVSSRSSYGYPLKGGVRVFKRTIVGITAAKVAVPAGTTGCVALIGLADRNVDNREGLDGDRLVKLDKGVFLMPFPAATPADIGATVFALDDQTLQLTNANGALRLGTIEAIDAEGVWISI